MTKQTLAAALAHLTEQEKELAQAYELLGKQTQEFTRDKSKHINQLVDEIVNTKQQIQQLKTNRK